MERQRIHPAFTSPRPIVTSTLYYSGPPSVSPHSLRNPKPNLSTPYPHRTFVRLSPLCCDVEPSATTFSTDDITDNLTDNSIPIRPTPPPVPSPPDKSRTYANVPSAPSPFVRQPIPGPQPLPIIGNALDVVGTPLSDLMLNYARRYGVFLKFSILSDVLHLVSDPLALQHIHVTNARNYLDRWTPPGFGPLLYDGRLRGLVFSQGDYWKQHRKLLSSVVNSRRFLSHFVHVVSDHSNFLIDNIWKSSSVVNVHESMRMLTLDVIGTAALGTSFNAMLLGGHPIEKALASILYGVLDVIKSPLPLWRVMRTPARAEIDDNLRALQAIELDIIKQRRAAMSAAPTTANASDSSVENDNENDFLARLLRAHDEHRQHFTDDDLMWDVHDLIFAGHETTSSALAATLWLIAGSPRVLHNILNELDDILPNGRAVAMDDLPRLKYLDMTINESLRLYPPTALIGRISKERDVIAGYEVPARANILVSPYVMGRLPELWGDDVNEFKPERFSSESSSTRHPMTHTPFGAGPRVCVGARMAMMQAKLVLATVLRRVQFERLHDELEVDYNSTVSFKSGMDMRVSVRSS